MNIPPNINPFLQNGLQNGEVIQRRGYIRRMTSLNQVDLQNLRCLQDYTRFFYPRNANLSEYTLLNIPPYQSTLLPQKVYSPNQIQNLRYNQDFSQPFYPPNANLSENKNFQNLSLSCDQNNIDLNSISNPIRNNINFSSQQLDNNGSYQGNIDNRRNINEKEQEKKYEKKQEKKQEEEHAIINIYVIPFDQGNTEMVKKKKYKISYDARKLVNGKMILKINFKDVIKKYPEITSIDIIQRKVEKKDSQNSGEKHVVSKEIGNEKNEAHFHLKTNGKGQYETEISFKMGEKEIINIPIELETSRNDRHKSAKNDRGAEEELKMKLIYNFLPVNDRNSIFYVVNEISEIISDFFGGLEKYLKKKEKKLVGFLGKENKKYFIKQIKDTINEGFSEEILTNIENFFNEDIEEEEKNKLLIMCFDYLYIRIIDAIKSVDTFNNINDENGDKSMKIYSYPYFQKLLGEYGSGYCKKNDVIIMGKSTNRKRLCETEGNECCRKRQRMNIETRNDGKQTNENSESETFIS